MTSIIHTITLHIPKRLKPFTTHILIATLVLGGCIFYANITDHNILNLSFNFSNSTSTGADFQNTDFESYTANFFTQEIASSTLNLHYTLEDYEAYGITDPPTTFGTFTTDSTATALAIENQMAWLSTFDYDNLSTINLLTYDVIQDYLTTAKMGTAYTLFSEPLSPYTGLHTQLPILLAEYALNSEEEVIVYLELLTTLPEYFASLVAFEEAKSEAGLFMSDSQLNTVLSDCNAFIEMKENYLLTTFETRIVEIQDLSAEDIASYSARNTEILETAVIPAYQLLMSGLESFRGTGTNTQGLCYYENGRNYYAYLVLSNIGSSRTIPEIQVLIENQLLDDLLDLQQAYASLDSDDLEIPIIDGTSEELLLELEESMYHLFPDSAEVSITVNDIPEELEDFLSPAFYLIPTIDNTYENTIYMNNSYMTDDVTRYTTLAHEGYPGHLYQTTYFAETNPDPIRNIFSYGGYIEGWATYAEMCSYYLGAIDSPEDAILQKSASLNLGLYAYVDIGIHYEGWSLTDVINYFNTYGITDSATIIKIYDLIVATPSNYLKYYLGYLEFLELKKDCIELWGEEFSQIRFHEAVLDVGPVSFDVLRKYVLVP